MRLVLSAFIIMTASAAMAENLPDPKLTPGDTWISSRNDVCNPSDSQAAKEVLGKLRYRVLLNYGLGGDDHAGVCAGPNGCAIDHLISSELGGSDDIRNLWPLPNDGPWNMTDKQRLTKELRARVCAGAMPLAQAQSMLASDWIAAYRAIFGMETGH